MTALRRRLLEDMQLRRDAWNSGNAALAKRRLERLAASLTTDHPGTAASVREGLNETLTLQRFGVDGVLYTKLRSTNAIENFNSGATTWRLTANGFWCSRMALHSPTTPVTPSPA